MIPSEIAHFLEHAIVAIGGTRDASLIPHAHRVSGVILESDQRTLTCLVTQGFTDDLLPSLEDNRQFALTVCDMPSHETYQFKGTYAGFRPVVESDLTVYEEFRERFVERVTALFGFPDDILRLYLPPPALAVRMTVREIFLQTPGPGAGRRIVPKEEEQQG